MSTKARGDVAEDEDPGQLPLREKSSSSSREGSETTVAAGMMQAKLAIAFANQTRVHDAVLELGAFSLSELSWISDLAALEGRDSLTNAVDNVLAAYDDS